MNERIRELVREANVHILPDDSEYGHEIIGLEKFAELIVRECADVVAEHYDASEPWITPKTLLYHFGVE
jgi:hypothetical protein